MIKHIVMWEFKAFAEGNEKQKNIEAVKNLLEGLKGKIESIVHLEVGTHIVNNSFPCDMVLYTGFKDKQALEAYQKHPLHKEVAGFIGKVSERRTIVDYEL